MKTVTFAGQIINTDTVRLEINGKNAQDLTPLRILTEIESLDVGNVLDLLRRQNLGALPRTPQGTSSLDPSQKQ